MAAATRSPPAFQVRPKTMKTNLSSNLPGEHTRLACSIRRPAEWVRVATPPSRASQSLRTPAIPEIPKIPHPDFNPHSSTHAAPSACEPSPGVHKLFTNVHNAVRIVHTKKFHTPHPGYRSGVTAGSRPARFHQFSLKPPRDWTVQKGTAALKPNSQSTCPQALKMLTSHA